MYYNVELVALDFLFRQPGHPARVAVFPGAWNPPTIAHLEIARAARKLADEVIWVLPRRFPHKGFETADLEARAKMLNLIAHAEEGFSAALSDGGLLPRSPPKRESSLDPRSRSRWSAVRDAAERIAQRSGLRRARRFGRDARPASAARRRARRRLPAAQAPLPKKNRVPLPLDLPVDEVSSSRSAPPHRRKDYLAGTRPRADQKHGGKSVYVSRRAPAVAVCRRFFYHEDSHGRERTPESARRVYRQPRAASSG